MICNIIDGRKRRHRWKRVDAIIEATSHDNNVDDADERPEEPDDIVFDSRKAVSVADAIAWANAEPSAVTLYLYDEGSNNA
jgi:hypothetical protein